MTIPDLGMALLGLVWHPQVLTNFVIFSSALSTSLRDTLLMFLFAASDSALVNLFHLFLASFD